MEFQAKERLGKGQASLTAWVPQETRVESTTPIRTKELLETLKGVSEFRTVKDIAARRGVDVKAIYKQLSWLRNNGYLNEENELTQIGFAYVSGGLRTGEKRTRLHNARFRVEILKYHDPRFARRRREYLEFKGIHAEAKDRKNWEAYSFAVGQWGVEVTPKSFLLIAPDILTDDSHESLLQMFLDVKKVCRKLEHLFPVALLEKGNCLNVRVEGLHAARINDALAKKYNKERRVFELRDEQEVRIIIDNSKRLNELEAVSPVWAVDDDAKVKRLLHEAVVQDISMAQLRDELQEMKGLMQQFVETQKLQVEAGIRSHKQITDLSNGGA